MFENHAKNKPADLGTTNDTRETLSTCAFDPKDVGSKIGNGVADVVGLPTPKHIERTPEEVVAKRQLDALVDEKDPQGKALAKSLNDRIVNGDLESFTKFVTSYAGHDLGALYRGIHSLNERMDEIEVRNPSESIDIAMSKSGDIYLFKEGNGTSAAVAIDVVNGERKSIQAINDDGAVALYPDRTLDTDTSKLFEKLTTGELSTVRPPRPPISNR